MLSIERIQISSYAFTKSSIFSLVTFIYTDAIFCHRSDRIACLAEYIPIFQ